MIRVLIIDDDELVTMSLGMILKAEKDMEIAGTGAGGADAVKLYSELRPDILLCDIRMEDMTGLDAAEKILSVYPEARILFLTTFSDDEYIIKALKLGVKGYLLKQDYRSIADSLRAVMSGQNVFGGQVVSKLPELMARQHGFDYAVHGITQKEYEIIQLVAQGLSNKEIASKAFLSEGTVKNHLTNILGKLALRDRTQLAIFGVKNGY